MIGIFDSGLGGLTIFKSLIKDLPSYDYIYLGDNARVPYGTRSFDIIYQYTQEAVDYLFRQDCVLIILACNTASAIALRKIQQEYLPRYYPQNRVLGVLIPAAEEAAQITKNKKIGVIGTEATIKSKTLLEEIKKRDKKIKVYQNACPLLVPLIETNKLNWRGLDDLLKEYLEPLKKKGIDTLILGCTHYALIKKPIQRIIGQKVKLVSEDEIIVPKLKDYLKRHPEIEKRLTKNSQRRFLTTAYSQNFEHQVKLFMRGAKDIKFELVSLV